MGKRTQSLIGTASGVATVRVYSANPKTADGYNTFVFRREIEKSLRKLMWCPIVELSERLLPAEALRSDGKLVYTRQEKDAVRAFVVDMANKQKGPLCNDDFGSISIARSFVKEVQLHAIRSKVEIAAVSAAREIASTMVHICGAPNEDDVRKNGVRFFEYGLQRVRLNSDVYLVLGEVGVKVNSMPYYDQRIVAKFKADSEAPSLHGHLHIGESAFEQIYDNRFRLILQGVDGYYEEMRHKLRYKSEGEVHKDFHGLTCATLHYLVDNYGKEAMIEVLKNTAQKVYKTIREELIAGKCDELAEYWDYYLKREGGDFAVEKLVDGVRLVVRDCPALRHLVKLEQEPDAIMCEATRIFNEALSEGSAFAADLQKTGVFSCVQSFRGKEAAK